MKKLIILASIVLILISCDNGGMNDKPDEADKLLIGTWEDTWEDREGEISSQRFIFTANGEFDDTTKTFENDYDPERLIVIGRKPLVINCSGSYQATDSTITLFNYKIIIDSVDMTPPGETSDTRNYSITKNELTMTIRGIPYTYKRID